MSVSVLMPQLGESVTEGTVTRWLKKEGEQVTADEPRLWALNENSAPDIPGPASGIPRPRPRAPARAVRAADPVLPAPVPRSRSRPRRVVRPVLCVAVLRPARAR